VNIRAHVVATGKNIALQQQYADKDKK